jgi:phage shock protein E
MNHFPTWPNKSKIRSTNRMSHATYLLTFGITLFVLILIGLWLYDYAMNSPLRISVADARDRLAAEDFDIVLDVRTFPELAVLGKFPGAVHIPAGDLRRLFPVDYPDRELRILIYCNTGQRARKAAEVLRSLGYKKVVYVASSHLALL